ncbi:hypothetical protein LIA77_04835 [Sarocladium implicatum]|nr:hypothetical protein LIA77_04835 [Sarocladium implicatum]
MASCHFYFDLGSLSLFCEARNIMSLSAEATIAIIALFLAAPQSFILLWSFRRRRLLQRSESTKTSSVRPLPTTGTMPPGRGGPHLTSCSSQAKASRVLALDKEELRTGCSSMLRDFARTVLLERRSLT